MNASDYMMTRAQGFIDECPSGSTIGCDNGYFHPIPPRY
jgi:hypothetical protein